MKLPPYEAPDLTHVVALVPSYQRAHREKLRERVKGVLLDVRRAALRDAAALLVCDVVGSWGQDPPKRCGRCGPCYAAAELLGVDPASLRTEPPTYAERVTEYERALLRHAREPDVHPAPVHPDDEPREAELERGYAAPPPDG